MKRFVIILVPFLLYFNQAVSQNQNKGILLHGIVMDSGTEIPLTGTQIFINGIFFMASDNEGRFAFYINRNDTITFSRLGYKPAFFYASDTLHGREFIAGIYMNSDTVRISEVIIVPRFSNLKSEMMGPGAPASQEMENARYNLAISAYQGRISQGRMGDPATNYSVLRQKQKFNAYSKGQIPSDQIVGISPLLLVPATYLLLNGLPEKPAPLQPRLTEYEVQLLHKKYLKSLERK